FMDGFSYADQAYKWDVTSSTLSITTTTPRTPGGYKAQLSNNSIYKTIPSSTKVIAGMGFNTATNWWVTFYGDAGVTSHITVIRSSTTGFIEIRRGNENGTVLATGTQVTANGQWNYVEVSVTISDTVGEVHVRLNGGTTDEVSFTGDTKNGGTVNATDRLRMAGGSSNFISDVYVLDDTGPTLNSFLGDVVVRTITPTGNGASSQLVGSDGNSTDNYLLVDEHGYSSVDYVGSATATQKDTYAMADLPAGVTTVYAVQVMGFMEKSDATTAQSRLLLRSGGTDYTGVTRTLTTSTTGYYELYTQDPATSAAWTPSGVNGIETGMEVL
ncbi:MAG: hypothetical protein ABIR46_03990, partial [Candidatus Saccharimonadales bacterium]